MSEATGAVDLTVRPAPTGDERRGIARLPAAVQSELGVVTGDQVLVEGDGIAVASVWPSDDADDVVRIGPSVRSRAGTAVGDTVTVRAGDVEPATAVRVRSGEDATPPESGLGRTLRDEVVRAGTRLDLASGAYEVVETRPEGPVRITVETEVTVAAAAGVEDEESGAAIGTPPADPGTTYEDIGGLEGELDRVRETIELPLAEPEQFERLDVDPPTGVLLHGPPGTGKTLIAKAVATEVDASFQAISGPEVVSKYKGESEQRLREVFERASADAPSIVFVDEIDAIAGARDADSDMENRIVAQLLTLMDGLTSSEPIVVIGATNRLDAVDPALRRGGRFDREIEIGVPDERSRRDILAVHTRSTPLGEGVDLDQLAADTHGFVGADLAGLVREASIRALQADRPDLELRNEDFAAARDAVEPSAMREYVAERPTVTFDDVGGLSGAKAELREAVEWPLSYGPLFEAAGTDPPSGVLLHGPPGTGKTLLARATAGESGVNFLSVAGPALLDRYVGESEAAIRDLFERARRTAPAIVFVDEIDALGGHRGDGSEVTERVVSQLLAELDRAAAHPNLVVLAATNRFDALDGALLRPGRLERHVEVGPPDEAARREILAIHTDDTPLAEDVDLDEIAAPTAGATGADLEALVRTASLRAIRDVAADVAPAAAAAATDDVIVTAADFEAAMPAREDGPAE